jgi:hypothetical protein
MKISRRTFFKQSAKATAALSIAPAMVAQAEAASAAGEKGQGGPGTATDNKLVVTNANIIKRAELSACTVTAGDSAEFIITLTVGKGYTSGPSRLVYDFPATLGQSRPSLRWQEDFGYIEVYVSNPNVTYTKRIWDVEAAEFVGAKAKSYMSMAARMLVLDFSEGLKDDDIIEIHWGDSQRGFGPGTSVSCVVPAIPGTESTIDVRYFDSTDKGLPDMGRSFKGYDRPVPDFEVPLAFKILPRQLHHLRVIRKLDKALLIPNDRFWNVAPVKDISSLVNANKRAVKNRLGVFEYADKNVNVISRKLPLLDTANVDNVFDGMNIYWGELHTHSMFSNDCIDREKMVMDPGNLMEIARDRSGLDFYAVSDHHQPWDQEHNKIGQKNWARTIEAVRAYDKAGRFLVFPGFEFRGPRGDTVITFGWLPEYAEIDRPEWKTIRELWAALKGRDYLSIPHFHNIGSLKADEWWYNSDEAVEPVIEIFSCHGSWEREEVLENGRPMLKDFRPDRTAAYFLSKGHRYGLVCNSDDHKGHPGINGLTAVFSKSLDKKSVFEAYRKRHVYGTTNARIRLIFTANGKLMGSVIPNSKEKIFRIDTVGENNLKKIDLYKNGAHYKRFIPKGQTFQTEFTAADDEPSNWYLRVTQLDNQIAYSSPVWFV